MTDITPIIQLVIELVFAIIAIFVLRWLRNKIGDEKTDEAIMWVQVAVKAAEQIFGAGRGIDKKNFVLDFLRSKNLTYDEKTINALIESEVQSLTTVQNITKKPLE